MNMRRRSQTGNALLVLAVLVVAVSWAQQLRSQETAVAIKEIGSNIDWNKLPSSEIRLSNNPLTLTEAGTYVLTGSSNAGVVVDSEGDVRLILDNVEIHSESGAAIQIESADNALIVLADGSENILEDAATRQDESVDATLFSSDDLLLKGSGKLTVVANFSDAIASKDDLMITAGDFVINSADDAIRGKDSLVITGGNFLISAKGDGLKSTQDKDIEKGYVHILDGSFAIEAGDDAIEAVNRILIDGGNINVSSSLEGMEANSITINDGDIVVVARDDGINAVRGALGGEVFILVNGGNIDVTVGTGDTDAFDSNGSIYIKGGDIKVTAPTSSFDYDVRGEMTGGTLVVNGQTMTSMPQSRMGGPGRGRGMPNFWPQ